MAESQLGEFSRMIEEQGEQRRQQEKEYSDKLGAADAVRDEDEFYRVEGGVLVFRRFPSGIIDRLSRREFTDEHIQFLAGLLTREPRKYGEG